MFKWLKKRKEEPEIQKKRESIQMKSDAADALLRSLENDRRSGEDRRRQIIPDFEPERRHA